MKIKYYNIVMMFKKKSHNYVKKLMIKNLMQQIILMNIYLKKNNWINCLDKIFFVNKKIYKLQK